MVNLVAFLQQVEPVIPQQWGEPLLIAFGVAAASYAVRQMERRCLRAESKEDEYRKELQETTAVLANLTDALHDLKETILDDRPSHAARPRRS